MSGQRHLPRKHRRQLDHQAITVKELCKRYLEDAEKGFVLGKKRRPKKGLTLLTNILPAPQTDAPMQHPPWTFPVNDFSQRQRDILDRARATGRVLVDDLAAQFGVSPQTIRRDLVEMCQTGQLMRTHGGAVVTSGVANLAYEARRLLARDGKRRIGAAAAAQIPSDSSLFINIGTTTEEVARALARHHGLLVITNNLHVASELHRHPAMEVVLAGGAVRRSDGGIVGGAAVAAIRSFRVDTAVIGTSAIAPDGTLLDYDVEEVLVSRAIIESARRVILVADSGKFSRTAPVRIADIREVDLLVTDRMSSAALADICREAGVLVIEAGGAEDAAE